MSVPTIRIDRPHLGHFFFDFISAPIRWFVHRFSLSYLSSRLIGMEQGLVQSPASHAEGNNGGFDIQVVELGLRLTVLSGGDCSRASKLMGESGHPIDSRTLKKWRDSLYSNRYEQLIEQIREELNTSVKDVSLAIADQAQEVELAMISKLPDKLDSMEGRDLARSVQALAQAGATHIQTNRLLDEKPTSITETRPPAELIAELRELGVIDAEHETLP